MNPQVKEEIAGHKPLNSVVLLFYAFVSMKKIIFVAATNFCNISEYVKIIFLT